MSPPLLISKLNACGLSELDDQGGDHPHDGDDQGGVDDDQDGCDDDGLLCFCIGNRTENNFVQLFDVSGLFLVDVVPIFKLTSRKISTALCISTVMTMSVSLINVFDWWRIAVDHSCRH